MLAAGGRIDDLIDSDVRDGASAPLQRTQPPAIACQFYWTRP
jgi:hypothetical protein